MATRVEEVLQAIEELTEEEREQVRAALERLPEIPSWATPLERRMLAAGIISRIADPRKLAEHIRSFEPVQDPTAPTA